MVRAGLALMSVFLLMAAIAQVCVVYYKNYWPDLITPYTIRCGCLLHLVGYIIVHAMAIG